MADQRFPQAVLDQLSDVPHSPGVYVFKSRSGRILYIGKAKDLSKRVKSYFHSGRGHSMKTIHLLKQVQKIEWFVVANEDEAIIHEADLIRLHQPPYNIDLKGGQRYPFIAITREKYPRIMLTRNPKLKGVDFYGPFPNVRIVKATLRFITENFGLRECKTLKKGGCLEYQMKNCSAPCIGKIGYEDYHEMVKSVDLFLKGRKKKLLDMLNSSLKELAETERYEEAARVRDVIHGLQRMQNIKAMSFFHDGSADILAFGNQTEVEDAERTEFRSILILNIRDGRMAGRSAFNLVNDQASDAEGEGPTRPMNMDDARFLLAYYSSNYIPDLVIVPADTPADVKKFFCLGISESKSERLKCRTPANKQERELVTTAQENLDFAARSAGDPVGINEGPEDTSYGLPTNEVLRALKNELGLKKVPYHIEAIDISHQGGKNTLASVVVFMDGHPKKENYRTYNVRMEGPDDYAAIKDVVKRRFSKHDLPDLLMIDGGRGQLNAAMEALEEIGVQVQDIMGLAKRFEIVHLPNDEEIIIGHEEPVLRLLQKVRDEAHRFAITRMRRKRDKVDTRLTKVPGVGPVLEVRLIEHFGSYKNVRNASVEDLCRVEGVGKELAKKMVEFLSSQ